MFDEMIDNKKEEMLSSLSKLISFPSVSIETNDPSLPFGEECKNALDYALALGDSLGFRTKNIDGYCGYIEFGEGEEIVGIIGHLDVVPADDNWTYPPFQATIQDNKLYGRGAIDDKGPVISALYAMKAVADTTKVHKRVRLILGLNEEKDWKCIHYYKEHEEIPTIGFSPDADFPCIYAEKGILTFYLKQQYDSSTNIKITNVNTNHNAINVVPKYCDVTLELSSTTNKEDILHDLQHFISSLNVSIDIENIDTTHIKLISHGIAAHAAHPDLGTNAISQLLILLNNLFEKYKISLPLLNFFTQFIGLEFDGKSFGIQSQDESGCLTLNVGNFSFYESNLQIGFNLRVPINTNLDHLSAQIENIVTQYSDQIHIWIAGKKQPLYINKDNFLVETLCSIFNQKTGRYDSPIAIGGATYARSFDNCISFGANMPGHQDMCHQVNEYIDIDNLILSSKIYAEAIYQLSK